MQGIDPWPLLMILGGGLNFAFQYLLLFFERRAPSHLSPNLQAVRERFESRNAWAALFCVAGFFWTLQELVLR